MSRSRRWRSARNPNPAISQEDDNGIIASTEGLDSDELLDLATDLERRAKACRQIAHSRRPEWKGDASEVPGKPCDVIRDGKQEPAKVGRGWVAVNMGADDEKGYRAMAFAAGYDWRMFCQYAFRNLANQCSRVVGRKSHKLKYLSKDQLDELRLRSLAIRYANQRQFPEGRPLN